MSPTPTFIASLVAMYDLYFIYVFILGVRGVFIGVSPHFSAVTFSPLITHSRRTSPDLPAVENLPKQQAPLGGWPPEPSKRSVSVPLLQPSLCLSIAIYTPLDCFQNPRHACTRNGRPSDPNAMRNLSEDQHSRCILDTFSVQEPALQECIDMLSFLLKINWLIG